MPAPKRLSSRHDHARLRLLRNHARSAAARLCLRHLSDGRKRRRSHPVLGRAGNARRDSARRLSRRLAAGAHRAFRRLHRHRRHRFQGGDGRLRRAGAGRDDTWINKRIRDLYFGLHGSGTATASRSGSNDDLVGGLYGVSLGRAFFGESMFHRARDASKVALVHLVARLIAGGFELLDTQYVTEHLRSFGAVEIAAALHRAARQGDQGRRPPILPSCRPMLRSAARGAGDHRRARPVSSNEVETGSHVKKTRR